MSLVLLSLVLVFVAVLFWRSVRPEHSMTVVGACFGLAIGLAGAGLYGVGDARSDRVADLICVTFPAVVWALAAGLLMVGAPPGVESRRRAARMLALGVVLLLMAAAGRLSLVDAQIVLAIGAVMLLVADQSSTRGADGAGAVPMILLALLAGAAMVVLVVRASPEIGAWALVLLSACAVLMVIGFKRRDLDRGAAALAPTALVMGLGGGAIGGLVRVSAFNLSVSHPVGFKQTIEVLAVSVAASPPLIGLGRLVPEAVVLIVSSALVLAVPGASRAGRWGAIVVWAGAIAMGSWRLLALLGRDGFVF